MAAAPAGNLLLVLTVITYAPELTLWLPNTVFDDAPR